MKTLVRIFNMLTVVVIVSASSSAQSGILDNTFDIDGIVLTSFGTNWAEGRAIAIQADGKIVAAGKTDSSNFSKFALARYNTIGSLDTTFGVAGKTTTLFGIYESAINTISIQTDGKILAAGSIQGTVTNFDYAIARYNINGTLDTTFSNDGKTSVDITSLADFIYSMAIQPDGKIVVAGASNINFTDDVITLARFNTNGDLDSTFDFDGKAIVTILNYYPQASGVVIQPDGKIIVGGGAENLFSAYFFCAVRLKTDGSVDSSYGTSGHIITDFGGNGQSAFAMALQNDGKMILAGAASIGIPAYSHIALARYNSSGIIDSTFNFDGKVTTLVGIDDVAFSVVLDSANKIIVAGSSNNGTDNDFIIAKYNHDGSPDSTFNLNGTVTTDFNNNYDRVYGAAIQSDNKIVVAGASYYNGWDFALARYQNNLNVGTLTFTNPPTTTLVYPNPITNHTTIEYSLTSDEHLSITLLDIQGRVVKTFITNASRTSGNHKEQLTFDNSIAAGNYVLSIENSDGGKIAVKLIKN